jgi:hypothetical protein
MRRETVQISWHVLARIAVLKFKSPARKYDEWCTRLQTAPCYSTVTTLGGIIIARGLESQNLKMGFAGVPNRREGIHYEKEPRSV